MAESKKKVPTALGKRLVKQVTSLTARVAALEKAAGKSKARDDDEEPDDLEEDDEDDDDGW